MSKSADLQPYFARADVGSSARMMRVPEFYGGTSSDTECVVADYEDLSSLIGDVYDAALNPGLWPAVIAKTVRFLPGYAGALLAKDATNKTGGLYYDDGALDPHYKQTYFETYIKLDPTSAAQFISEIGVPVTSTDVMPFEELSETRFFREWVKPQGLIDFISVQLERSANSVALFGVFRHESQGFASDETRRRMRLIAPHIRRAALIGKVVDLKKIETATLADSLDSIVTAIFLIDPRGQIVHANSSAQAMLSEGDLLSAAAGQLAATDAQANETLKDVFNAAGGGDAAVGEKGIAVPMIARSKKRYIAHILPLMSGARRRAGVELSAASAVFVRPAHLDAPPIPEVIAKVYRLTPGELRVLLAVFESGGVADIAALLGISETTAKTHLRRLFEKTSTRRQADLVKLVAGFSASQR